jgi:hypothetical protein
MLKLHIEMNISALIVRVVRATGDHSSYPSGTDALRSKVRAAVTNKKGNSNRTSGTGNGAMFSSTGRNLEVRIDAGGQITDSENRPQPTGITKVTQTHVTVMPKHEEDDASSQSSTRHLKDPYSYP